MAKMKLFLSLLCVSPIAVTFAIVPFARTLWGHIVLALAVSRNDAWARQIWWDWYGSWIFFGGPFGRWIWGTAMGFTILKSQVGRDDSLPGEFIEKPHLRLVILVLPAVLLSVFAVGLALTTLKAILLGATSLEALGPRSTPERQTLLKPPTPLIEAKIHNHHDMFKFTKFLKVKDCMISELRAIGGRFLRHPFTQRNPVLQRLRKLKLNLDQES
ncbi:hypothetical protein DXG01_012345 [Tephrocybe rancida]|nr:hypothetical protein DXG01_012345 [Tephrocybe rancida]